MAAVMRSIRRMLSICLALVLLGGIFAEASVLSVELTEEGRETYDLICKYIDQGDAKSAVNALLEEQAVEEAYACLNMEDPEVMEYVLLEAACLYNEDGALFNIVELRLKGFISDELFLQYWGRIGTKISTAIAGDANYDVYLFLELLNWYDRGAEAVADIIDLRYLGMIDNALYSALVEEWNVDLMDDVDLENYIPLYGMRLSEDEKEQIRVWQAHVDEGESQDAAVMVLNGDMTENAYRWLLRNDAGLIDVIHAQVMYENVSDGSYEQNINLILEGFVSDACFERYWNRLNFIPAGNERSREDYPGVDMYFIYEVERICAQENNDFSLLQWIRDENLIDAYTFELLFDWIGGWENEASETQND